uniref:Fibronectin type-III domain-containing protein n=1 Tax=Oncorhynchus tshawytscha TaxID=74940 RepID=A0A8C8FQE7_ONCTS
MKVSNKTTSKAERVLDSIMDQSSYRLLQILSLACLACRLTSSSFKNYGTIIPQSPTVEIGKEFTATCVVYEAAKATVDDIYWTSGGVIVPKEQYTKINDSAVNVTIPITRETGKWLLCKKNESPSSLNKSKTIHGIELTKGYPPEKPENLSCMAVQFDQQISSNVTCTWQPGKMDEKISTTFTLFGSVIAVNQNYSTKAQRSSGCIYFGNFPNYMELDIWVDVENNLGKVRSDVLFIIDPNEMVKTNPPLDVNIISEKNFSRTLLVSWKHPIHETVVKLKYNLRFCTVGSGDWTEVPPNDTESSKESFRLQYLKPDMEHVVQVRCMHHTGYGYWSDWSANSTARTPEDKPTSKPDLWRVVIPSQGKSERRVEVICKDPVESNGRIRGYNIKIQDGAWEVVPVNGSELNSRSQERKMIPLYQIPLSDKRRGSIELKAWNSVGESPRASLGIPKLAHEPPPVASLSCFNQDRRLWVEWQPPNVEATGVTEYVLEWVSVSDGAIDWQREPRHNRKAPIKGTLQRFKLYSISVYPMYSGWTGKPLTTACFLEQGAPLEGPSVKVRRTGKSNAEVEWMEIPLDKRRGFITNYTIFYITGGKEHSIVVSPDTYSYTVEGLASNSKQVVRIMASTVQGSTNGSDLSFNTLMYAPGQMEATVVSVCIGILFVIVLTVSLCMYKIDLIKKIWPPVPDPSNSTIANWSPDFPTKAVSPKESVLGDVSVVEVDVFDRKSLCEEDKAGLPLKKDKYLSEEHSSGIGGSSCMSTPRQSVSDSEEGGDSGQTTTSTVQYSSVVASNGYKGQSPCTLPQSPCTLLQTPQCGSSQSQTPSFARSESTQPLLDSEESQEGSGQSHQRNPYFSRSPVASESRDPGDRNQLEMEEQGLASLRFCPLEEGSQQTTPTDEGQSPDEQPGPVPSYMPQLRGHRQPC